MAKILALAVVALLFFSCGVPPIEMERSGSSPAQSAPLPQESPPPDTLVFAGRTSEEVLVAAKIVLGDLQYAIKSSDSGGGLLVAARRTAGAGEAPLSTTATLMLFADPAGRQVVKVQVVRTGQGGDQAAENQAEIEMILASIRDLLR